jgi:hypothetical protein
MKTSYSIGEFPKFTGLSVDGNVREQIKSSERVKRLLSERNADGEIPFHPYAKWYGAHWVLVCLAELGYSLGNQTLIPLREQVYRWLFSKEHERTIRSVAGRIRRHASQEGNAVYAFLTLGLADERTELLAERLRQWQWPDGGWNCDTRPGAATSSFTESLIPLRALGLHARLTGNRQSRLSAERAAEFFLKRRLFKRQTSGAIISPDFVTLHFPCYWHYDFLFGLKVMAETGFIDDERCGDALDLLESKQLCDGGFPAEKNYYRVGSRAMGGRSLVSWGRASAAKSNEFVTADALSALKRAGRLL